jgi:hypothetical protein
MSAVGYLLSLSISSARKGPAAFNPTTSMSPCRVNIRESASRNSRLSATTYTRACVAAPALTRILAASSAAGRELPRRSPRESSFRWPAPEASELRRAAVFMMGFSPAVSAAIPRMPFSQRTCICGQQPTSAISTPHSANAFRLGSPKYLPSYVSLRAGLCGDRISTESHIGTNLHLRPHFGTHSLNPSYSSSYRKYSRPFSSFRSTSVLSFPQSVLLFSGTSQL